MEATREDLERFVYAWNTTLKEAVKSMSIVVLLRNCHPVYRATFASELKEAGLLRIEEAKEFIKIVSR